MKLRFEEIIENMRTAARQIEADNERIINATKVIDAYAEELTKTYKSDLQQSFLCGYATAMMKGVPVVCK